MINLKVFTPVIDENTGKITGYKTAVGGADTVFPFSDGLGDFEVHIFDIKNLKPYVFKNDTPHIIIFAATKSGYNISTVFKLNGANMPISNEEWGNIIKFSSTYSDGYGAIFSRIERPFHTGDALIPTYNGGLYTGFNFLILVPIL